MAGQKAERLDKWVARQGQYSRKQVHQLVRAGRIKVNGGPAAADMKVGAGAVVELDGEPLQLERHVYIMLNKPRGVVCATRDNRERTVLDLLPAPLRRPGLFPAGRLDKDAEGFVLVTDDGGFAHRILSPKSHVEKKYFVRVDRGFDDPRGLAAVFEAGADLGGGEKAMPAKLEILKYDAPGEAELTICEGKFHQVKRMLAMNGYRVVYLKRVAIGGLALDPELAVGACRSIVHKELERI